MEEKSAASVEENVYEAGPFDLEPGGEMTWLVKFAPPEVPALTLSILLLFYYSQA